MRFTVVLMLAALVGCSSPPITGTVTDALSGSPIAGDPAAATPLKVQATAVGDGVSMQCAKAEGIVQADGTFTVEGACTSNTSYQLSLSDKDLWIADNAALAIGAPSEGLTLSAYRAPSGESVYVMSGSTLTLLKTSADVKTNKVLGTTEIVRSPSTIPAEPPLVAGGDMLLFVGKKTTTELKILPLVASGPRQFDDPANATTVEPWSYVGIKFTSDTEFERLAPEPDASKVISKEDAEHAVKYVKSDALPPGRYAILKDKDRRMYIVDIGARPAADAAPAPEAAADGKAGKAGKAR